MVLPRAEGKRVGSGLQCQGEEEPWWENKRMLAGFEPATEGLQEMVTVRVAMAENS